MNKKQIKNKTKLHKGILLNAGLLSYNGTRN